MLKSSRNYKIKAIKPESKFPKGKQINKMLGQGMGQGQGRSLLLGRGIHIPR